MAKPTWDDTEEFDDIPSFDDTEEIQEISKMESGLRGAAQGASMGFIDELLASLGTKGASPSQIIAEPKKAIETEKQMMKDYDSNLAEERAEFKAAADANPATSLTSEIAGGILPGLLTGGGATAANVAKAGATLGAKAAMKTAAKEGGKLGAKYGAVSGVGYSEEDDLAGLATDAALGGTIGALGGAVLPVGVEGAKRVGKNSTDAVKALLGKIPGAKTMAAGYKYGKKGKSISTEQLDDDLSKIANDVLDNIKQKKADNNLSGIKDELDAMGIKVDTKEAVNSAIDDLEKIKAKDFLNQNDDTILTKLQEFSGRNLSEEKLMEKAIKDSIKKKAQAEGLDEQAIIKAEKALTKQALKKGEILESLDDTIVPMDDLAPRDPITGNPLATSEGSILKSQGKFTNSNGEQSTKSVLSDVTDFQPEISKMTGPDGRTIINTKDLGTGKINTLVGNIEKKVGADIENMSLNDVDILRNQLNEITKLAKVKGSTNDPSMRRATDLAVKLKELTDNAAEKFKGSELVDRRNTFSDVFTAEDMLGIKGRLDVKGSVDKYKKATKLMEALGTEGGINKRRTAAEATRLLGDDVVTPGMSEDLDIIKALNVVTQADDAGNISRSGLYKQAVGFVPNIIGQGVKKVSTITNPVIKASKAASDLTSEQLAVFGQKLATSNNPGSKIVGDRIIEAMSKEGPGQSQAIWALSQSPGFREMVRRYSNEADQEVFGQDSQEAPVAPTEPQDGNLVIDPSRNPDELTQVIDQADSIIDRVNQQQSSGDNTPMSQLDELLAVINDLKVAPETIDELERDATDMVGFTDGQILKDKLRRLQGIS
jgi:hypothetical protein